MVIAAHYLLAFRYSKLPVPFINGRWPTLYQHDYSLVSELTVFEPISLLFRMEKKDELDVKLNSPDDCSLGTLTMDDKRLIRKVDWQIMPIMFFTYFLQMIDKISINVCLFCARCHTHD